MSEALCLPDARLWVPLMQMLQETELTHSLSIPRVTFIDEGHSTAIAANKDSSWENTLQLCSSNTVTDIFILHKFINNLKFITGLFVKVARIDWLILSWQFWILSIWEDSYEHKM